MSDGPAPGGVRLSAGQVASLAASAGWSGRERDRAVAIARCESSFDAQRVNFCGESMGWGEARVRLGRGEHRSSGCREVSVGLWQINILAHAPDRSVQGLLAFGESMTRPLDNAERARAIYEAAGNTFSRDWVNCSQSIGNPEPVAPSDEPVPEDVITPGSSTPPTGGWWAVLGQLDALLGALSSPEGWRRVGWGAAGVVLILAGGVLVGVETRPGRAVVEAAATRGLGGGGVAT